MAKKKPLQRFTSTMSELNGCTTCAYSRPITGDNEALRCHRHPLTNRVTVAHWCGEWKGR